MDDIAQGRNVIICSGRQLGKTALLAWICLWACLLNTMPIPTTKKTRIILVSNTDDQSKKIIGDIREFMILGDEHLEQLTTTERRDPQTGKVFRISNVEKWFTSQIDYGKDSHNNMNAITFKNGCQVISLPPTDKVRGFTASLVMVDEAAFIDDDVYEKAVKNVVSKTGNRILLTSTPNGRQGFFFKLFDPEEELHQHPFDRIWLPYTSLSLDDPKLVSFRDNERNLAISLGNEREFDQEHMASFNSATASFFATDDVDAATHESLDMLSRSELPCDLAVDFGGGPASNTVITISRLEGEHPNKKIRLLYQHEYPNRQDLSLIDDIVALMQRYNVQRVIFDDCPAAEPYRQVAETKGWNMHYFTNQREKLNKYMSFRTYLRRGQITMPLVDELQKQMKGLIQEETPHTTRIYHGNGLRDDRIDSFMMSTYFFTEEKPAFRVWDVDEV